MPEERSNGHINSMYGNPGLENSRVQAKSQEPVNVLIETTEWLANWTTTLREADLAAKTIRWYERDVILFLAWMVETTGDPRPTYVDIATWRDLLITRGKSTATVNRALASIKRFMGWAVEAGITQNVGTAKFIKELPSPRPALNRASTIRLINRMERDASPRDRAIIMLALGAGLRASEISSLRIQDCTFTAQRVEVSVRAGKGRVSRRVTGRERTRAAILSRIEELEKAISEGSEHRRDRYAAHDSVLTRIIAAYSPDSDEDPYERIKGEELIGVKANWVGQVVAASGRMANISHLHPHMLRRTFGQIRRASGASIEVVAREMGHASIDTTVRYTMPIEDDWDVVGLDYI